MKTRCVRGHLFNTANTYVRPNGHQECRECKALRKAGLAKPVSLAERLEQKTIKGDNCWQWMGSKDEKGYGTIQNESLKVERAHRISYRLNNGPIPAGLMVLHTCDNPECTNPEHLFLGTNTTNMQDMAAKGRGFHQKKTHCPQGHPYTPENTGTNPTGTLRYCIICKKAQGKLSYQNRKSK